MSNHPDSLWPSDIHPNVSSPYKVLLPQAEALAQITSGLLVGELTIEESSDKSKSYTHLDMVAPLLGGYRRRILTLSAPKGILYPVRVEAEMFRRTLSQIIGQATLFPGLKEKPDPNEAATDEELRSLVRQVLNSPEVKAAAVTLIAHSNDVAESKRSQSLTRGTGDANVTPLPASFSVSAPPGSSGSEQKEPDETEKGGESKESS